MQRTRQLFSQSGMTLAEYGLSGALVIAICAGTMLAVGNQMETLLSSLKQDMKHRVEAGRTTKGVLAAQHMPNAADDNAGNVRSRSLLTVNPEDPDELCSQDGWCVKAPAMTGDSVFTTGSNGLQNLTSDASDVYMQMSEILRKEGNHPQLSSLLNTMAQEGNTIGEFQERLSSMLGFPQIGGSAQEAGLAFSGLQNQLGEFSGMANRMNDMIADLPADKQALLSDATHIIMASGKAYALQSYGSMLSQPAGTANATGVNASSNPLETHNGMQSPTTMATAPSQSGSSLQGPTEMATAPSQSGNSPMASSALPGGASGSETYTGLDGSPASPAGSPVMADAATTGTMALYGMTDPATVGTTAFFSLTLTDPASAGMFVLDNNAAPQAVSVSVTPQYIPLNCR